MAEVKAPPVRTLISDMELFAKAYFRVELTDDQKAVIKSMAYGRPIIRRRGVDIHLVRSIFVEYILEGLKPGGRVRLPSFDPPVQQKLKGLSQTHKILKLIRQPGGAFNFELARHALKYTSVISELRKAGYGIVAERQYLKNGRASNTYKYYLVGRKKK